MFVYPATTPFFLNFLPSGDFLNESKRRPAAAFPGDKYPDAPVPFGFASEWRLPFQQLIRYRRTNT
jgi:hypothetical protein